jgi:hypothetical protein
MKKEFTAIIFIENRSFPIKYRKISNLDRFVLFTKNKYPLATSVNFYERDTKAFFKQIKLK